MSLDGPLEENNYGSLTIRVRVFREACERADRGKRGRVPLTFVRHAVDVAGLLAPRDEVEGMLDELLRKQAAQHWEKKGGKRDRSVTYT